MRYLVPGIDSQPYCSTMCDTWCLSSIFKHTARHCAILASIFNHTARHCAILGDCHRYSTILLDTVRYLVTVIDVQPHCSTLCNTWCKWAFTRLTGTCSDSSPHIQTRAVAQRRYISRGDTLQRHSATHSCDTLLRHTLATHSYITLLQHTLATHS